MDMQAPNYPYFGICISLSLKIFKDEVGACIVYRSIVRGHWVSVVCDRTKISKAKRRPPEYR
jgi:hypothetical protein